MEQKFTSGPWKAYKDEFSKDGGPIFIDFVHTPREKQHKEIAYAYTKPDARLIAAAPDMYEALETIYAEPARFTPPKELALIGYALAKAEGKEVSTQQT